MNVRELKDLGLYFVGMDRSDRLAQELLRGWEPRRVRLAGSAKALLWVGMSILCSIGIGQLN